MVMVILVRHGETAWNRREVFRGRADVELNERGREQAQALGAALEEHELETVYSSPLRRAVETAEAIAKPHNIRVEIEEGFIDFDYGRWQGLQLDEVRQRYPKLYQDWIERPHTVRMEGGESLRVLRRRAMGALRKVTKRHPDETVVIVAHRVVNKVILCAVLGLDNSHFWQIRQDTCAFNVLEWSQDRWVVRLFNDTCHLKHVSGRKLIADF